MFPTCTWFDIMEFSRLIFHEAFYTKLNFQVCSKFTYIIYYYYFGFLTGYNWIFCLGLLLLRSEPLLESEWFEFVRGPKYRPNTPTTPIMTIIIATIICPQYFTPIIYYSVIPKKNFLNRYE
jgi:hypothetical protein